MTENADVAIVGGGVIGCALARELARRGIRTVVLERAVPGAEASGAAAGLLSPQSDARDPGPLFDLGVESRDLYPSWIRALEEESGRAVRFQRPGVLRCAPDDTDDQSLSAYLWQRERGLPIEVWDSAEIARRLPRSLSPSVVRGLYFSEDASVDSGRLTRALALAATRLGARIATGTRATELWLEGDRCRGVQTESGRIEAARVVDAAGAWASLDGRIPLPVPVEPVRGQILELELPDDALPVILRSDAVYVVPRGDSRALVGATQELVGFRKEVSAGGIASLLGHAFALLPSLSAARFVSAWAGLRPGTPDGLPILGGCRIGGLLFAAGHYRSGILLAPLTARLLADEIEGSSSGRDLSAFSVERFASAEREPARTRVPGENIFR